jgi:hypothetical protein
VDKQWIVNSYLPIFQRDADWDEFCRETANAGGNAVRILTYAPWGLDIAADLFCPYKWDGIQGAWNLDKWHEPWFAKLREMVDVAKKYNLKLWLSLFDNCQFHHGCIAPWGHNVQARESYFEDIPRSLAFVEKVVGLFGNEINYEICNEGTAKGDMKKAVAWYVAMYQKLMALKVPEANICWGATVAATYQDGVWEDDRQRNLQTQVLSALKHLPGKLQCFRAMHSVGVPTQTHVASYAGEWAISWWGGKHTGKGWLSDDGVKNGANSADSDGTYQRPSPTQWYICAKRIFEQDGGKIMKWAIEHCPKNYTPEVMVPTLAAIVQAYHDVYGVWSMNYGKFPKPQPVPVPEPEPIPDPPQPEPVMPKITVQGWIALGLLAAGFVFCAILLIGG